MKAVFLDRESLDRNDLDLAAVENSVEQLMTHPQTTPDQVQERLKGQDIVIVNKVVLDREALEAHPPRLICVVATGVNNIDLDACRDLNITVCNSRGYGTDSVAQHSLSLMLALSTRLLDYHQTIKRGDWQRSTQFCLLDYPIQELAGKTLVIVGHGTLGRRVADLAKAFGMHVRIAARPGNTSGDDRQPLSELLPLADVVSLHCPLNEATQGLIDSPELAAMKPTALLINTARGGLVNEAALASALRRGEIGGAGIDVVDGEPPAADNPLFTGDIPNLIVTPHNAWGAREARQRIVGQLVENILGWQQGRSVRVVSN
ncbi:2-hydroxyacid dehydrogenase [Halomonas sp. DQ26W]|uniref:2-hydroxyacid dehydrogenase n=1 Tax=Halomonas sp. DQ26W TaxID=2282311 RepID=UPI000DF74723|nr:2-hydroxyacid dehydrogenase [Halomonas sp. DQ26W]RDB44169.1 2-hydroxyacid dehydrogenase [Halomonas sp. DQ26W]